MWPVKDTFLGTMPAGFDDLFTFASKLCVTGPRPFFMDFIFPLLFLFSAFASFYCSWGQELLLFLGVKRERKIGHFRAALERVTGAILGGKGKLDLGLWVDFWESSEARRVLPKFFFSFTIRFLSSGMGEQHHSCFGKHLHGRL